MLKLVDFLIFLVAAHVVFFHLFYFRLLFSLHFQVSQDINFHRFEYVFPESRLIFNHQLDLIHLKRNKQLVQHTIKK